MTRYVRVALRAYFGVLGCCVAICAFPRAPESLLAAAGSVGLFLGFGFLAYAGIPGGPMAAWLSLLALYLVATIHDTRTSSRPLRDDVFVIAGSLIVDIGALDPFLRPHSVLCRTSDGVVVESNGSTLALLGFGLLASGLVGRALVASVLRRWSLPGCGLVPSCGGCPRSYFLEHVSNALRPSLRVTVSMVMVVGTIASEALLEKLLPGPARDASRLVAEWSVSSWRGSLSPEVIGAAIITGYLFLIAYTESATPRTVVGDVWVCISFSAWTVSFVCRAYEQRMLRECATAWESDLASGRWALLAASLVGLVLGWRYTLRVGPSTAGG